jgi:hypothetical protein
MEDELLDLYDEEQENVTFRRKSHLSYLVVNRYL